MIREVEGQGHEVPHEAEFRIELGPSSASSRTWRHAMTARYIVSAASRLSLRARTKRRRAESDAQRRDASGVTSDTRARRADTAAASAGVHTMAGEGEDMLEG